MNILQQKVKNHFWPKLSKKKGGSRNQGYIKEHMGPNSSKDKRQPTGREEN